MSQYPGWIHPGEFPDGNLIRKFTAQWKVFGTFTSLTIVHILLYPEKNTESLIVSSEFLNFAQVSFDITTVILQLWYYCDTTVILRLWCALKAVNYYHKALHLGYCSSPRFASVDKVLQAFKKQYCMKTMLHGKDAESRQHVLVYWSLLIRSHIVTITTVELVLVHSIIFLFCIPHIKCC